MKYTGMAVWATLTLGSSAASLAGMFSSSDARRVFLPGKTTDGHYQIELACSACHTDSFTTTAQLQAACERCHSAELARADDSHPKVKFTDPRNAERVAILDARLCVTCHQEHNPATTGPLGVTLPEDYCHRCHSDIADDRPSHQGLAFDSCDDAGCHNFHDNRALYEDYLLNHLDSPDELPDQRSLSLSHGAPSGAHAAPVYGLAALPEHQRAALEGSAHGRMNVGCPACHAHADPAADEALRVERCGECHLRQLGGWLAGRHGMRVAVELSPLKVSSARAEMRPEAKHRTLTCDSCHSAHAADTRRAAVDACTECHADEHTRSYEASAHAALWRKELAGDGPAGSGVSCATCHMPRVHDQVNDIVYVEHNQNENLRPNDKMVRSVCERCHGPGFALAALADDALVRSNFSAFPRAPHESMRLVRARSTEEH